MLVKTIPMEIKERLNNIQKEFIWNGLKVKIRDSVLCSNYMDAGLKNVTIGAKIFKFLMILDKKDI